MLLLESQFISVIAGPLRSNVGLSDQEISDLADYFRVPDGRIFYTQLCEVIHDSGNYLNCWFLRLWLYCIQVTELIL